MPLPQVRPVHGRSCPDRAARQASSSRRRRLRYLLLEGDMYEALAVPLQEFIDAPFGISFLDAIEPQIVGEHNSPVIMEAPAVRRTGLPPE